MKEKSKRQNLNGTRVRDLHGKSPVIHRKASRDEFGLLVGIDSILEKKRRLNICIFWGSTKKDGSALFFVQPKWIA
jgi:hypothetical protein